MKPNEPVTKSLVPALPPGQDIDGVLRSFFQRQLPNPWPAPPSIRGKSRRAPHLLRATRLWHRARRPLALAAALGVFLLGYWLLANVFPTALDANLWNSQGTFGGSNPTPPFVEDKPNGIDPNSLEPQNRPELGQTQNGNKVQVFQSQEGDNKIFRFELLPKGKSPPGK